jgi:hypothetical protein
MPLLADVAALPEAMMLDTGEASSNSLAALATLLRKAGVPPRAELLGPDGQATTGVNAQWLRHGDTTILTLQTVTPWGAPGQIEVRLSKPAVIKDLRVPGKRLQADRFVVALDPITPTILSLEY